jgi:hypothetical protein
METNSTKLLAEIVRRKAPGGTETVRFLTKMLSLSKESAYRRMRGNLPFTFKEICLLSFELHFSVDEIIRHIYSPVASDSQSKPDVIQETFLETYSHFIKILACVKTTKAIILANRINLFSILGYETLFKFFYYRNKSTVINPPFSETVVPEDMQKVRKAILDKQFACKHTEYIFGKDLFASISLEIQYFHLLKILTDEETLALKSELLQFLKKIEIEMQTGKDEAGNECLHYLSLIDVENNSICVDCEEKSILLDCGHFCPVIADRNDISAIHRKQLESQKTHTGFITQSNEFVRLQFIQRQRNYIESVMAGEFAY